MLCVFDEFVCVWLCVLLCVIRCLQCLTCANGEE
jgi:hypothetical protein